MGMLERFVHGRPAVYAAKHAMMNGLKRGLLRLFGLGPQVERDRVAWRAEFDLLLREHLAGRKVLEVGCGEGAFIAQLCATLGCKGTAIDLSPAMIGKARATNPGPRYAVMDGAHLAFPDNTFDVVVFNQVLHHIADIDRTITEARRTVATVLIVEPCPFPRYPLRGFSRLYWALTDGGERYQTLDEWRDAFNLAEVARAADRRLVRNAAVLLGKRPSLN